MPLELKTYTEKKWTGKEEKQRLLHVNAEKEVDNFCIQRLKRRNLERNRNKSRGKSET